MADSSPGNGVILLWSGGKDAMLTLDVLHSQSPRRVGALLTTVTDGEETVRMHGTPRSLIERQAEAIGIPLHVRRIPPNASNATYESHLEQALTPLVNEGYSTVVVGDLFLEDIRAYREQVLSEIGVTPLFPLWHRDTTWLAQHFLTRGYTAVVTSVDSSQLDPSFVGRAYDEAFLQDLPSDVDPCGEHGAFHTFVTDGPPFQHPVDVSRGETYESGRMRYVQLREGRGQEGS